MSYLTRTSPRRPDRLVHSRTGPIRQPAVSLPRRNAIVALDENGAPDFTALQAALPEQDTDADLLCYSTMISTFCSMTEPTCDHNRFPIAGQGLIRPARRPAAWVATSFSRNSRRNSRESTRTGRKKPGRQDTHLRPSKEIPPPRTVMWTCGWWASADPQVCSTEGSAAIVMIVSAEALNIRS